MKDWDSLYKEKGVVQQEPSKRVKEALNFFEKEGLRRILDLGCGTGRHTVALLKSGFDVYGCDSSESALKIAISVMNGVDFRRCDMTLLPYEDRFFDGIVCNFVIQHGRIVDIRKAIAEIHRVLRNGGILFLTVPSINHPEYLTGEEIEPNTKINIDAIDGKSPHHYFSEDEMKDLFCKFEIIKLKHFEGPSEKNSSKKLAAFEIFAKRI